MGHLIWLFVIYVKYNAYKKQYYIGKTSGLVETDDLKSATKLVRKRDSNHHRNKDGFDVARVETFSTDSDAIRGREQIKIDEHKSNGDSGNLRNSISPRNPNKTKYIAAAIRVFGDVAFSFWLYSLVF